MPLIGEILEKSGTAVYTTPFGRGSDSGKFRLDAVQREGTTGPTLDVAVQHRNLNDDTWTDAGTFTSITATGVAELTISSGIKELVRFKFTFSAGSTDSWFRIVILPVAWT